MKIFEKHDPKWLVDLAKAQYPEETWLAESLSRCTLIIRKSSAYYYFIDPDKFDYKTGYQLNGDHTQGEIIVDVMKDNSIGGIELLLSLTGNPFYLSECEKNKIVVK